MDTLYVSMSMDARFNVKDRRPNKNAVEIRVLAFIKIDQSNPFILRVEETSTLDKTECLVTFNNYCLLKSARDATYFCPRFCEYVNETRCLVLTDIDAAAKTWNRLMTFETSATIVVS